MSQIVIIVTPLDFLTSIGLPEEVELQPGRFVGRFHPSGTISKSDFLGPHIAKRSLFSLGTIIVAG